MILLDTHIWVWLADQSPHLSSPQREAIERHRSTGLGICAISLWEVAKLVELGRLKLAIPVEAWMDAALTLSGIRLMELTPQVAIASTQLPPPFHRDPADQMIVATARLFGLELMTADDRIRHYPHVRVI